MKGKMALGYFEGCVEGIEVTKRKKLLNEIRLRRCDGTQSIVVHSKEQWQELKKLGDEAFGVSDWVKVIDRLPEKKDNGFSVDVLVFDGGEFIDAYYDFSSRVWCHMSDGIILRPSHWMPLPEPPK